METDPRLADALEEVVEGLPVRILRADAMTVDWAEVLGTGTWRMASNLPYNVAVPVVMTLLADAPGVDPLVVMVQREVGERLAAGPGTEAYGGVSVKVAYRARVRTVRRLGASVFWPAPKVDSVVLRLDRHPPPVEVPARKLFALVDAGFAQRRKTLASALVRMGLSREAGISVLRGAGLDPRVRAEALGLEELARVADALPG